MGGWVRKGREGEREGDVLPDGAIQPTAIRVRTIRPTTAQHRRPMVEFRFLLVGLICIARIVEPHCLQTSLSRRV